MLNRLSNPFLQISSLPSLQDLQSWQHHGFRHLLNVSGIDINDLYPRNTLAAFSIKQVSFADIFSIGIPLDKHIADTATTTDGYAQMATEQDQTAFLQAVHSLLIPLQSYTPICVFCHRGQGRSPLVVAAALQQLHQIQASEAIASTQALHPEAQFTDISLSALYWCAGQFKA